MVMPSNGKATLRASDGCFTARERIITAAGTGAQGLMKRESLTCFKPRSYTPRAVYVIFCLVKF